jgi:hypothetical protein
LGEADDGCGQGHVETLLRLARTLQQRTNPAPVPQMVFGRVAGGSKFICDHFRTRNAAGRK